MNYKTVTLPLSEEDRAALVVGEACLLSGTLYTLRDAGHIRLLEELDEAGSMPYGLFGQTIFYAGPTPSSAGRPFGSIGPTTASRMDFAASRLYEAGIVATIGKGKRAQSVVDACRKNSSVYMIAVGGAAAYLAKNVISSELIAYPELGTEALRKIEVKDFPVFIGIDAHGNDLYES